MKVSKRILLLAVVLMAMLPAMAQFRIGPRVGINTTSLHFNEKTFDSDNRVGFNAGLQCEFTVPVIGVGFDASVMYVHRGSEFGKDATTQEVKKSTNYIEIPLNLKYKLGLPAIGKLITPYVFTGPSFAFRTSKAELQEFYSNKKCDVAWNFGFGVQLIEHLQIGASYGLGLNKVVNIVDSEHANANIEGKNRYWTVTAAWLF